MNNESINLIFDRIVNIEKDHLTNNDMSTEDYINKYKEMKLPLGTPILIMAVNHFEFLQHWVSILYCGYVPVSISPSTKSSKISDLIETFKIGALVSININKKLYEDVVVAEHKVGSYSCVCFKQKEVLTNVGEVVILTSGTSGMNTGCVHSISSILKNAEMHNNALGIKEYDRQLIILPLYYSFAMVAQAVGSLISGCSFVIDGPPFTTERFVKLIKDNNVTVAAITPTIARNIIESNTDFKKIRVLSIGGDQLLSSDVSNLYNKNISEELYLTYGLTEAGPRVSTLAVHNATLEDYDSVGFPFSEVNFKINRLNDSNVGELLIKSPTQLLRKIGKDVVNPINSEGYLQTGDYFEITQNGLLKYKGRIRDFIVYNGEKVNLTNINQTVQKYPNILHAKSFLNNEKNELGLEICLRDSDINFSSLELINFLKKNLQSFEVPKYIVMKDNIEFKK